MIKFGGSGTSKSGEPIRLIGIGLTAENIRRLQIGEPISFNVGEIHMGLEDCTILIVAGETAADIYEDMEPFIGPHTRFSDRRPDSAPNMVDEAIEKILEEGE